jgi:hypothetical protein
MHRCTRTFQLVAIAVLAFVPAAFAQENSPMPVPEAGGPVLEATPPGEPGAAPATDENPATAAVAAPATAIANQAKYGLGIRVRWVSVPSWFLGLFTQKNVPLSSYSYALEGYRRKVDRDDPHRTWELSAAVGFQNMSPSDGYWLGKGKQPIYNNDPTQGDTDLVQFRDFSLITMDAAFISRQYFNPYFGIHYGAGLGLAVVRGKILRTSATYNQATGQYTVVSNGNQICDVNAKCNEAALVGTQGVPDQGPGAPHRFQETSIPGAIPIINLLFGLDFPIPDAKGLELRIEGGFYDAFFLGGTAGYVF